MHRTRRFRRKLRRIGWCVGSAAGAAALSYVCLGLVAIPMLVAVVLHESGHYLMAIFAGAKPHLPIFVPLGIGVLGFTKVENMDLDKVAMIALAGPMVGAALGVGVVVGGLLAGSQVIGGCGAVVTVSELAAGIIGRDGRIIRQWKKGEMKICKTSS